MTDVTAKKLNYGRKCARITRAREDAALYFCLLFAFAISLHHPLLHSSFLVAWVWSVVCNVFILLSTDCKNWGSSTFFLHFFSIFSLFEPLCVLISIGAHQESLLLAHFCVHSKTDNPKSNTYVLHFLNKIQISIV